MKAFENGITVRDNDTLGGDNPQPVVPSMLANPVCGYLAKVTVPNDQCVEYNYPFHFGDTVLVFGDISQMPGHCVFAGKDGKIHFGYHTYDFVPLTDEEI